MVSFFGAYDLLSRSGLFDPVYYVGSDPNSLNGADPLSHYIEFGAAERRNPSSTFDTRYYLEQCAAVGAEPENPLLHFIERGAALGLVTQRPTPARGERTAQQPSTTIPFEMQPEVAPSESTVQISIEAPGIANGAATAPVVSSLSINGWSLATNGVASVDIAIDDARLTSAYYGIRRDDVAAAFPDRADALLSGFAALIPARALSRGQHKVGILVRDKAGNVARPVEFTIDVGEIAEDPGPWALRRKLAQSEIDLYDRLLTATEWHPAFCLVMLVGARDDEIAAARVTLSSLARQPYTDWHVTVVPANATNNTKRVRSELLRGLDEIAEKITFVGSGIKKKRLDQIASVFSTHDSACFIGVLIPGDELGVEAFLEFACWTAVHREAELIYCDERRLNPGTGYQDAYFKPDWSPDLLLSANYIGRLWIASLSLIQSSGMTLDDVTACGEYHAILRLTEHATKISHVPHLLIERSRNEKYTPLQDKTALESAITRRKLSAVVADGCAPGFFRLRRTHSVTGPISIVIATRAARGLIKVCIDSIRNNTNFRNFEIVCIENISEDDHEWRSWLYENADKVVSTTEPFNWSRFNNMAVEKTSGEYLIFLNDDVEIITPDWIDVLLSYAERREVGIVGPLLLYPDRTIQHAGVFLTRNGIARHAFRYGAQDDPGYFGLALTDRNVIGVTGACLMTRRDTFDLVGRFDESHAIINNDLDFCLRVWDAGFLNIYTAQTRLIHHELASRSEISDDYDRLKFNIRWGDSFLRGDPYFHPRLSKDYDDYAIDREPVRVVCPGHPMLSPARVRRLLITKLDHIGDAITAIPAITRLRALFPDARLSLMSGRATKAVWSLVGGIDEVIEFDFFHARSGLGQTTITDDDLAALRERLAPYRFDLAIDLRKSPDTRHILKYTNAQYLAGFGHQRDFPWLDITLEWEGDPKFLPKHSHVSDDLLRLVQAIELACNSDRTIATAPRSLGIWPAFLPKDFAARRIVAIHPAAGTPTRQWPPRYFAQLIDLLIKDHDVNIAIIGAPDETDIADAIMADVIHPERVASCLGKMELQETFEFLPKCALFVGNNSGPSHIAALLGVPTVAVHSGVVASEEWAPYGPTGVAVRRDMTCSPCYIAQPEDCPRSLACLERLDAGEILKVCSRFLATA